ncbi:chemotaxis protein CheW [Vibrio porteresiae]|uniref:Chemotaxis protein CheW n=1 Tax=Vibrio porteresiae DSM 19223 TaxID=1123496 RepID=A0ABZ0QGC5_9VIBR|nr:chemotaxis protein CheW [Vibrio porteresiae]WPC75051.1 chemotaxis protein CheW [Vibrio porteresiae DSM 19223]
MAVSKESAMTETHLTDKEAGQVQQLLTFLLDNEVYGADISQIQEVLEYRKVTKVPRTPAFMLGVINLRGKVVPVIDLRRLFAMAVIENTVNTCIVIVDVMLDGEDIAIGILADAVKEVIELTQADICAPPRLGHRIDTRFISGVGKKEDEFVIILDLGRVIGDEELHELVQSTHEFDAGR